MKSNQLRQMLALLKKKLKSKNIRAYLLAGLVIWLPILATIVIVRFIIDILDQTMALLPQSYQPEQLFGVHIPGLGVLLSLSILLATGIFAKNYFGQWVMIWSDAILNRIPLVRSIYITSKQIINAILATNSQAFRKVLLVEYPRKGMWSLAFQTGGATGEITDKAGCEMVSLFIPTTPNPTSGFLMMAPKSEVIEMDMTTDAALKYIISLGVTQNTAPDDLTQIINKV